MVHCQSQEESLRKWNEEWKNNDLNDSFQIISQWTCEHFGFIHLAPLPTSILSFYYYFLSWENCIEIISRRRIIIGRDIEIYTSICKSSSLLCHVEDSKNEKKSQMEIIHG